MLACTGQSIAICLTKSEHVDKRQYQQSHPKVTPCLFNSFSIRQQLGVIELACTISGLGLCFCALDSIYSGLITLYASQEVMLGKYFMCLGVLQLRPLQLTTCTLLASTMGRGLGTILQVKKVFSLNVALSCLS